MKTTANEDYQSLTNENEKMSKKSVIKEVKGYALFLLLLGFVAYVFWKGNKDEKQLKSEGVNTFGIIVKTFVGAKSKDYVKYEFEVNGVINYGNEQYFPNIEYIPIEIGDTCEVVYARSNPDNCRLLTNRDQSLKIRRSIKK